MNLDFEVRERVEHIFDGNKRARSKDLRLLLLVRRLVETGITNARVIEEDWVAWMFPPPCDKTKHDEHREKNRQLIALGLELFS